MPPDTTDEERQEQLPEDSQTPFNPADPPRDDTAEPDSDRALDASRIDDTHQVTDSGSDIDSHELYDEGVSGAVEASEPNAGSAVLGYTPPDSDSSDNGQTDDPQDEEADMPSQPS